ncbi:hypothetical protein RCL1_007777 [Eukaryota sp. TZLM3-RCL]
MRYEILSLIGSGQFGSVFKALDTETNNIVAIKQVRLARFDESIPKAVLRELTVLQSVSHSNVLQVHEVFFKGATVSIVSEHCFCDLVHVIKNQSWPIGIPALKSLIFQLLKGLDGLHSRGIIHRDVKPANLLLSLCGEMKIADLGLARFLFPETSRPLSGHPSTRWYRAPEVLFGSRTYDFGVDIWAVGCIFAELLLLNPLFPGINDIDQLQRIISLLGTPSEASWPGLKELYDYNKVSFPFSTGKSFSLLFSDLDPSGLALLSRMLCWPPSRISAKEALESDWFYTEPLPLPHCCLLLDLFSDFEVLPCLKK